MLPTELNIFSKLFDHNYVFVSDNYHGQWPKLPVSQPIVVYHLLGENFSSDYLISNFKKFFPNSYVFLISVYDYQSMNGTFNGQAIWFPLGYSFYANNFEQLAIDPTTKLTKHFLSLNNRAGHQRHALWQLFVKYKLLDKSIFSYLFSDRFDRGLDVIWDELQQSKTWYNEGVDWEALRSMLPLKIEENIFQSSDNYWINSHHWFPSNADWYNATFASIVTETYNSHYFTEKIFKPIAYKQPFLLLNSRARSLEFLRNLGFKTFDGFIDESYDTIEDPNLAMESVFKEILRLSNISIEELHQMKAEMQDILDHNYKRFWNEFPFQFKYALAHITNRIEDYAIKSGIGSVIS